MAIFLSSLHGISVLKNSVRKSLSLRRGDVFVLMGVLL